MGVPIVLLALALVLATTSRTPRTALPMLLLVQITGASLCLQAILLGKVRIATCNGLAPFVRLGLLRFLKSTK